MPDSSMPQRFHEGLAFFVGKLDQFAFNLAADQNRFRADLRRVVENAFAQRVAFRRHVAFANVADEKHRLGGDQVAIGDVNFLVVAQAQRADGLQTLQAGEHFFTGRNRRLRFFALLQLAAALQLLFHRFFVFEYQFQVDRFDVADRIDFAVDVDYVRIFKAAHDMQHRVDAFDRAEERVAFSKPLRRAFDQSGDVDQFDLRRDHALGVHDLLQHPQALVGHADHAGVRIDRAERIVGRLRRLRHRQRIENGALTDIRQAHDPTIKTHVVPFDVLRSKYSHNQKHRSLQSSVPESSERVTV